MAEENYQVIYRKYRPKDFSEIAGQEHIVQTLRNAIAMGRIAHAYLFTGPRGTGKTTIARILAKAVNCEGSGQKPCNKCQSCLDINESKAMDLVEIDAASNRGIDEIRELRDGIKFAPVKLKYKFFIIDECHMLTPPAFNALLKTLEEPPAHAIFVLATTELHKVPETIMSRCERFDFHKLSLEKITGRLALIAQKEKIKIDRPTLEIIALNAEGAMRDAESLFGQLLSIASVSEDRIISLEEARNFLGATDTGAVIEMAGYLADKNLPAAVTFINKLIEDGYDLEQFVKSLLNYLRKLMILKIDNSLVKITAPELTAEQIETILNQGAKFTPAETIKILKLLVVASNEMKTAVFTQLPLEMAVAEFLECKM